tara:strand:+ start:245 stop:688 length:444 start_codon:yes stop_codon:yes gene_type:complete
MNNENGKDIKIRCELLPMDEYLGMQSEKKKYGKYHKTNFWDIKGYGQKKWVVCLKIRVKKSEVDNHLQELSPLTEREILESCFRFLNTPPPKKKYARKAPVPKYGKLVLYRGKKDERGSTPNVDTYSVLAIVEKQKNKYFWGKGKNV